MKMPQTNYDKASINNQLQCLSKQMEVLIDEAIHLEVSCSWYHDDDPNYGGLPSVDPLMKSATRLRAAYMEMAYIIGLDPCEQLPSTKDRFGRKN